MAIDIQLKSLFFSLLYGCVFSFLLRLNYKYLYKGPLLLKVAINIVFVLDNVLLYFIVLKRINEGIIHGYFVLMILLGFIIMESVFKKMPFDFNEKK
jgi:hypothetical protein